MGGSKAVQAASTIDDITRRLRSREDHGGGGGGGQLSSFACFFSHQVILCVHWELTLLTIALLRHSQFHACNESLSRMCYYAKIGMRNII